MIGSRAKLNTLSKFVWSHAPCYAAFLTQNPIINAASDLPPSLAALLLSLTAGWRASLLRIAGVDSQGFCLENDKTLSSSCEARRSSLCTISKQFNHVCKLADSIYYHLGGGGLKAFAHAIFKEVVWAN